MNNQTFTDLETRLYTPSCVQNLSSMDFKFAKLDLIESMISKFELPVDKRSLRQYCIIAISRGFPIFTIASYLVDFYAGKETSKDINDYVKKLN
jgi:hypothetical protein